MERIMFTPPSSHEVVTERCPVCTKIFTDLFEPTHTWQMHPKNRMLMHLIMSHPDNIKINVIGDPNDINTWIVDIKTTPEE